MKRIEKKERERRKKEKKEDWKFVLFSDSVT
jgi:hypothetical protein